MLAEQPGRCGARLANPFRLGILKLPNMKAMINLVATRQKAGTPIELLRWYNDHVNLLLRSGDLTDATLYRCVDRPGADTAPDYLCLYRFASMAAFAAFEVSAAKELARQVIAAGWGQHGIEIIERSQYLVGGQWTGQAVPTADQASFHIQCLNIGDAPIETQRWLADSLYLAANQAAVSHYQWYTSVASGDQQQVIVLASKSCPATPDTWPTWWEAATTQSQGQPLGQSPGTITVRWQAGYERLCFWRC